MTAQPMLPERHLVERVGWLRAAVLGANDGIVSTASLIVGVAAAATSARDVLLAGIAGLVAGAISMAAGEYVSVSSQADTEMADMARERNELERSPEIERAELAAIYIKRGLDPDLADNVASQLMSHNALDAHVRDELGISSMSTAQPLQAAFTSAATFAVGAALPLLTVVVVPSGMLIPVVSVISLVCLAALGAIGAYVGGSAIATGIFRVTFWGAIAMGVTAVIGKLFGTVV